LDAVEAVDFRRGIDGLARVCRSPEDGPLLGLSFVFRNKRATAIKLLVYDAKVLALSKEVEPGRFRWWPTDGVGKQKTLMAHELQLLIWNGNPNGGQVAPCGEASGYDLRDRFLSNIFLSRGLAFQMFLCYIFVHGDTAHYRGKRIQNRM